MPLSHNECMKSFMTEQTSHPYIYAMLNIRYPLYNLYNYMIQIYTEIRIADSGFAFNFLAAAMHMFSNFSWDSGNFDIHANCSSSFSISNRTVNS
jgi:hypothetical protein